MTIKRRLFFLNFRAVLVTFFTLFLFFIIMNRLKEEGAAELTDIDWIPAGLLFMAATFINLLLTFRIIRNILNSLKILSEGVRQVHSNNLAYRIAYHADDEFHPVCEAFNEMAGRLEKSVAQQHKDEANRRELIAGISHDLRTPLTSIKGCLEGLETGVASTPEMKKHYFTTVKRKTSDMEHIIEQLFLFSKLDMNEFPLSLRRVALMPVIADMIEEAAQEYDGRGLDIHIAESRQDVVVSADTLLLRNVLINILENSVRYKTKKRAFMEISADIVNNSVFLRFTDDGPGVPAETLEKLFDVFYRSDPSRNKKGSGIGLAISRKIIELMGGTIHAELPDSGGLAVVIRLHSVRDM
jgi:signal transduction histidine kinase